MAKINCQVYFCAKINIIPLQKGVAVLTSQDQPSIISQCMHSSAYSGVHTVCVREPIGQKAPQDDHLN